MGIQPILTSVAVDTSGGAGVVPTSLADFARVQSAEDVSLKFWSAGIICGLENRVRVALEPQSPRLRSTNFKGTQHVANSR